MAATNQIRIRFAKTIVSCRFNDDLLGILKSSAKQRNNSLNYEVLFILHEFYNVEGHNSQKIYELLKGETGPDKLSAKIKAILKLHFDKHKLQR